MKHNVEKQVYKNNKFQYLFLYVALSASLLLKTKKQ